MRNVPNMLIATALAIAASSTIALSTGIPSSGLPTAPMYGSTLLPELQGVVSWKTLSQVEPIKQGEQMVPRFSTEILDLDSTAVRVQGFILPLDVNNQQHHFLLSAVPPHCPFCMPAGPDAIVEVVAKKTIAYRLEPVILSGRFSVLKNDESGLLYRLTDAEPIAAKAK